MPSYNSKSQKRSKNSKNSKSGGRRRKHTMRKYRRGKKVMRGGAIDPEILQNIKNFLISDSGASVLTELQMDTSAIYSGDFENNFTKKFDSLSYAAKLKLKTNANYSPV
jgi:hypothetical protein